MGFINADMCMNVLWFPIAFRTICLESLAKVNADGAKLGNINVGRVDHNVGNGNRGVEEVDALVSDGLATRNSSPGGILAVVYAIGVDDLGVDVVGADELTVGLVLHHDNTVDGGGLVKGHEVLAVNVAVDVLGGLLIVVARTNEVAELLVAGDSVGRDKTVPVRGKVQSEDAVAANRRMVDTNHLLEGAERLLDAPEPAVLSLERGVALSRGEEGRSGVTSVLANTGGPVVVAGVTHLVTDPADRLIGKADTLGVAAVEDDGLGLLLLKKLLNGGLLGSAVTTIEPNLDNELVQVRSCM